MTDIISKILKQEPDLCAWGLADDYLRRRNGVSCKSPIDPEEFQVCLTWLSLCQVRKTVNPGIGSSYGLKHRVEHWSGRYVTNGAFIAAVIHLGIPFKRYPDSPNIHLALSGKGLPTPGVWRGSCRG